MRWDLDAAKRSTCSPRLRWGVLPKGADVMKNIWVWMMCAGVLVASAVIIPGPVRGGEVTTGFQVLAPIRHGNLTIFPVVASYVHDTRGFLTLDEGLRSGEVVVSEAGSVA